MAPRVRRLDIGAAMEKSVKSTRKLLSMFPRSSSQRATAGVDSFVLGHSLWMD